MPNQSEDKRSTVNWVDRDRPIPRPDLDELWIAALTARVKKLEAALLWYADEKSYELLRRFRDDDDNLYTKVLDDNGQRARAALREED